MQHLRKHFSFGRNFVNQRCISSSSYYEQGAYHRILGVEVNATPDEIKKAYRDLAKQLHPDVSTTVNAESRFKEVSSAYDVLSCPVKRSRYESTCDINLGHETTGEYPNNYPHPYRRDRRDDSHNRNSRGLPNWLYMLGGFAPYAFIIMLGLSSLRPKYPEDQKQFITQIRLNNRYTKNPKLIKEDKVAKAKWNVSKQQWEKIDPKNVNSKSHDLRKHIWIPEKFIGVPIGKDTPIQYRGVVHSKICKCSMCKK